MSVTPLSADISPFVRERLGALGYGIGRLDEHTMRERLVEVAALVNGVRREHESAYGWGPEEESYFLAPMNRKWEFSFHVSTLGGGRMVFVGISSVYGTRLHLHSQFTARECRGLGIGKFHMAYLCDHALKAGIGEIEAYTPRTNSKAVMFFLSTGWQIEDLRKNGSQLFLVGKTDVVRDTSISLLGKS
jgi:GNAT superfamily N-acetyltransferase